VSSVVMHTFKASPHLKGRLALVHINHLSIYKVALNLHASEGIIGAPVALALGVDAEVWALNSICDIIKHTTGLECSPYLGLLDNPVCFVKVSSKSYQ
jgi:hypothetical protein